MQSWREKSRKMVRNLGFFEKKKTQWLKREKVDREKDESDSVACVFFPPLFSLFLTPLLLNILRNNNSFVAVVGYAMNPNELISTN